MSVDKFLKSIEEIILYLTSGISLSGMTSKDLAQELRIAAARDYERNKDKKLGWWYRRLKWKLGTMIRLSRISKKPLDNSVSLETTYYEVKDRDANEPFYF